MERALAILFTIAIVGIVRYARFRRTIDRLEVKIRSLRTIAESPLSYRQVEPQRELDALGGELDAVGLVVLGDAASHHDPKPSRWFRDRDGNAFGWIALAETRGIGIHVAVLISRRGDQLFVTRRIPGSVALAEPPFLRRCDVPISASLAETYAAHRRLVGDAAGLFAVHALDEAMRELEQLRARAIAWRREQEPGLLLDLDLRAILGRHYAQLGEHLARRLANPLPRARVV
ncbi:MAG TPA: hypothetical protein VMJ10_01440 [Kofleriaceae bacterium]|nr:hypothetical protein [Kofleriaceae bacterium]